MMHKNKGFTLVEMMVVIVIIGILAALGWPNYVRMKEMTLNREARATLALIRAAEKVYRMEEGFYYPYLAATSNTTNINNNLKLALPVGGTFSWAVSVDGATGLGQATRLATGTGDGRVWSLVFPGNADPTCAGGTYCP